MHENAFWKLYSAEQLLQKARITKAKRTPSGPLSFQQERLWFLCDLDPVARAAYGVSGVFSIEGPLDVVAFEASVTEIVARHESLRTTFSVDENGVPTAKVAATPNAARFALTSANVESADAKEFDAIIDEYLGRPFDLSAGPLFRAHLIRCSAHRHVAVLEGHHIIIDGWSISILMHELSTVYRQLVDAGTAELVAPKIQYSDYTAWQRQILSGERLTNAASWWCEALKGVPDAMTLPADRPRWGAMNFAGGSVPITVSPTDTQVMQQLAAAEGATLFMLLQTVFAALLSRLGAGEDVVLGTAVAGRPRRELASVAGFFANTLALRHCITSGASTREQLAATKDIVLAALKHQHVPFEAVVQALAPARSLAHAPIVQVTLVLQTETDRFAALELAGTQITPLARSAKGAPFELSVELAEADGGLTGRLVYATQRFDHATAANIRDMFLHALQIASQSPDLPFCEIDIVSPAMRQTLLSAFNPPCGHLVRHTTLAQDVAAHAASEPDRPAVIFADHTISYGALNDAATRLAHHLATCGVGAEVVVGVFVDRPDQVVACLIAILRAGGAFLPLERDLPDGRIAFMLADAGARVLITTKAHIATRLSEDGGGPRIIVLDEEADEAAVGSQPAEPLEPALALTGLAYVIYTSGSTGRPKGVMVDHAAYTSFLDAGIQDFSITGDDIVFGCASPTFDVFMKDVGLPLRVGATLVCADRDRLAEPLYFGKTFDTQHVTFVETAPSIWRLALVEGWSPPPTARVVSGAEVLDAALARRLTDGGATVFNSYGPTECAIACVTTRIDTIEPTAPIGNPLGSSQAYVVDPRMELVPIGVPGELLIGGAQVSRGYVARPALTARAFVADAFGDVPGARLYRTGDLVRCRADGTLEFLGRVDRQVKVRGVRVELDEIEAQLLNVPGVAQAAVTAKTFGDDTRLTAYLVPTNIHEHGDTTQSLPIEDYIDIRGLRRDLQRTLPQYMVPAAFVGLSRLPLTASGKLDRDTLPDRELDAEQRVHELPQGDVERAVAAAFEHLVGAQNVGRHDDFFALGGHSLLAVRLIARLEQETDGTLTLRDLFEAPTVAQIAQNLTRADDNRCHAPLVAAPEKALDPFPLSDIQTAYYVGRQGGGAIGDVSCYAFTALCFPDLDVLRLEGVLNELVAAHPMLRAVLAPDLTQRVLPSLPRYVVPVLDWTDRPFVDAERAWAGLVEDLSHQVLPADRWPLFDVRAVKMPTGVWHVTFGLDLLIGDALSVRLLATQLFERYFQVSSPIVPAKLGFGDVVRHRIKEREGKRYKRAERYWHARLDRLPNTPQLPLRMALQNLPKTVFTRRSFTLAASSWRDLKTKAASARLTPTSVLAAVYAAVLARWSNSDDFLINLTVMGRKPLHPEIDQIVGDFTTITLLAVHDARSGPFVERAKSLQTQLISDLDHIDYSGVEVLRQRASAARAPGQPQVVFTSTLGIEGDRDAFARAERHGVQVIEAIGQTPQVLLDCQVTDGPHGLTVLWDAPEALYPDRVLDDMFDAFTDLVTRLAQSDDAWQDDARLPLPQWQCAIIEAANATSAPPPQGRLQDGFFDVAMTHPTRPALLGLDEDERSITFGDLADRGLGVADLLREKADRGPNGEPLPVAIVMDKCAWQVAAALGVLEVGAPFVPISPEQPQRRLRSILGDCQTQCVLTTPAIEEHVRSACDGLNVDAVILDDGSLLGRKPQRKERADAGIVSPSTLAYVMYTSGSTGEPKGVMISHRAAMNTLADLKERFAIGTDDRVLWVSDLSFDLSVFDLFGVLGAGGTVVFPQAGSRDDPMRWQSRVRQHGVTIWNSVPQLAEMAFDANAAERFPSLRLIMLSGDWIPLDLPEKLRTRTNNCQIASLGGATEAAIWSICYPIDDVDPGWKSVPYGKPLANQAFHVLAADYSDCPIDVAGELFISGASLARGYIGDDAKTAEKYVTHPRSGQRLYDTGDLGVRLASGDIEFLGRTDLQVKIRGHRVELGEVEAALLSHPDVDTAVATAVGPRNGRRIAAYVVPARDANNLGETGTPTIQSKRARAAFTLENLGRPDRGAKAATALPGKSFERHRKAAFLARQSFREFRGNQLSRKNLELWLAEAFGEGDTPAVRSEPAMHEIAPRLPLGLDTIGILLGALQAMPLDNAVVPKRLYGSAGGLYPVRAYLLVPADTVDGLDSGVYVYDPIDHALLHERRLAGRIGDTTPMLEPTIALVGHLPAIAPMYGDWSRDACAFEAGGALAAIADLARENSIGVAASPLRPDRLIDCLGIASSSDDVFLTALTIRPGKALRSLSDDLLPVLEVGASKIRNLREGIYRFDRAVGLVPAAGEGLANGSMSGINARLHGARAFSVAIAVNRAVRKPPTGSRECVVAIGAMMHWLSQAGVRRGIGVCVVAGLSQEILAAAFGLQAKAAGEQHMGMLVGGPVTAEQQQCWTPLGVQDTDEFDIAGGRKWLAERLPAPFIPSSITVLDRLPLTATGKVDRGALPLPEQTTASTERAPPSGPTESVISKLFTELLDIENVYREDDFFGSGGDSLTAARLASRLEAETGKPIALRTIFASSTVATLAEAIDDVVLLQPTPEAIAMLRDDPSLSDYFDETYGIGSAQRYL